MRFDPHFGELHDRLWSYLEASVRVTSGWTEPCRKQKPHLFSCADAELAAEPPAVRSEWLTVMAWRIAIVMVGLGFWQFASGRLIKPFWISSPSEIWRQLIEWVVTGDLWMHVQVTLTETVMGFVFGAYRACCSAWRSG